MRDKLSYSIMKEEKRRMQIEELLKSYELTMLLIEHDKKFCEKVGSRKFLI